MNRLFVAAFDDDTLTSANLGEDVASQACRSDEMLRRDFTIHASIISDITWVQLLSAASPARLNGFDR